MCVSKHSRQPATSNQQTETSKQQPANSYAACLHEQELLLQLHRKTTQQQKQNQIKNRTPTKTLVDGALCSVCVPIRVLNTSNELQQQHDNSHMDSRDNLLRVLEVDRKHLKLALLAPGRTLLKDGTLRMRMRMPVPGVARIAMTYRNCDTCDAYAKCTYCH